MKIIETPRLYLRELKLDDREELSKVLSDPDSMKYYPHPFSSEEVVGWIKKNIERYRTENHGLWAVILKTGNPSDCDGTFVGDCGITIQNIDGELLPEIGFHTLPDYCCKGIASEAALACIDYAFRKLGYQEVYSYSTEENIPSQKTALKIGMAFHKRYQSDGQTHLVYIAKK